MSQYSVFRLGTGPNCVSNQKDTRIGPDFNKAAGILEKNKDVKVLKKVPMLEMFVIEAQEASVNDVKKSLPGWGVERQLPPNSL